MNDSSELGGPSVSVADLFGAAVQLHQAGRLQEAEAAYRRVLRARPDVPDAYGNLGHILVDAGRLDEAEALFRDLSVARPDLPSAQKDLAIVLQRRGRLADAAAAYRRALELKPDYAAAHYGLGGVLHALGRFEEAATCFQDVVQLEAGHAEAHCKLGNALQAQGRLLASIAPYRRAIELKPNFAEPYNNLGNTMQALGRFAEAASLYARALALKPDFVQADSNRLLCLLYDPAISDEQLYREHRLWDERHGRRRLDRPATVADPERKLRIGYVSADFHRHPVGYFLAAVLETHRKQAFEVVCYTNGVRRDDMTCRLEAAAAEWRSLVDVSDDRAAAMVREDRIDLLIDLSGHTARNRLGVFARGPAPVQVSWLGYPGTTGLSAMDYLIMDEDSVPRGAERWCSEAVVRLPHGRFCYAPPHYAPEVALRDAGAPRPVTFGSFHNLTKVGPGVVRLWAAVLAAVPGSRLVLKWTSLGEPEARAEWRSQFERAGVHADRLDLRGPSPHPQMLAEYAEIDIGLDPSPFSGGLTNCEALWMGVPVVTLPGTRPASRQTLSFLNAVGLPDCAATSERDYVRICAALAADPDRLRRLRRELRGRMAGSPLADASRFTPSLESAYRQMWRRWCAGAPVSGFEVAPPDNAV